MSDEPKPKDAATRAAEALQAEWSIGTRSHFCDDVGEFDAAETEEIADIIRACYGERVGTEALREKYAAWEYALSLYADACARLTVAEPLTGHTFTGTDESPKP